MAARTRPLKTNACTKTGRPQKGFEAYRTRALEAEPDTFPEFMRKILASIEKEGGEYSLGYVDPETRGWTEYQKGMTWNYVRAQVPGKGILYSPVENFLEVWEKYKAEFERRRLAIAFN